MTKPIPHYLKATLENIEWIVERWPDLVQHRLKGTPRPWRQLFTRDPAREREGAMLAHLERHDAELDLLPGFSPAPLHVSTLDVMVDVLAESDLLHEHVAQTVGHPRLDSAYGIGDDPRRFLAYVHELLVEACETDPDMVDAVTEKVSKMREVITRELGEVIDGQNLDAICPFCLGRTSHTPVGGARTMFVRLVGEGEDREALVVCEAGECKPFAAECGLWVEGNPAWRWPEWDWLAERLIHPRSVGVA